MKRFSDKHRSERSFVVGDWVYLRLQPYRQITTSSQRPHKLSPKYYGPYQISEKIGTVAYRLSLPAAARIHPVFHVSQLKKKIGDNIITHTDFPSYTEELVGEPETILDRRSVIKGRKLVPQVLIKWKQRTELDSTWESYWDLVKRFPTFDLEARSNLRGGNLSGTRNEDIGGGILEQGQSFHDDLHETIMGTDRQLERFRDGIGEEYGCKIASESGGAEQERAAEQNRNEAGLIRN